MSITNPTATQAASQIVDATRPAASAPAPTSTVKMAADSASFSTRKAPAPVETPWNYVSKELGSLVTKLQAMMSGSYAAAIASTMIDSSDRDAEKRNERSVQEKIGQRRLEARFNATEKSGRVTESRRVELKTAVTA